MKKLSCAWEREIARRAEWRVHRARLVGKCAQAWAVAISLGPHAKKRTRGSFWYIWLAGLRMPGCQWGQKNRLCSRPPLCHLLNSAKTLRQRRCIAQRQDERGQQAKIVEQIL